MLDSVIQSMHHSGYIGLSKNEYRQRTFLSKVPHVESGYLMLFVGPEGGFVKEELDSILNRGIQVFHLEIWTLRIETAACAMIVRFTNSTLTKH